ncbi:endo alpha-1,4 polygalactosaminidase [Kineosporia sp. J2-2]|uniref:Endo alpha-1,4 polygalactosaminidase n=1 Tax=Kineosporia corallincola TaxID=2835133 RepID=A0ABS5TNQ3_9ACTN|nr:endo alpha-1,4 polygalactosaminidase [Kineosporia corallincola]MBT0772728.1 endo alpha-1,4 polygalactosaminidase [Kineosporia corallincola]
MVRLTAVGAGAALVLAGGIVGATGGTSQAGAQADTSAQAANQAGTQPSADAGPVTSSPSSTIEVSGKGYTLPPLNGKVDIQLAGGYRPGAGVRTIDRDRSEDPVKGVYSICYINGFQTQDYEKSFWTATRARRALLLKDADGKPLEDANWPGEYILDTSTKNKRAAIARIEYAWIDDCAARGYQAVDPDNLDTWTRFPAELRRADNLALAKLLAGRAHSKGLAIAQKNAGELSRATRKAIGFDFAVVESCQVYDECGLYDQAYGDRWFEIEYTDNGSANWNTACDARGDRISVIYRDPTILPKTADDYHYEEC